MISLVYYITCWVEDCEANTPLTVKGIGRGLKDAREEASRKGWGRNVRDKTQHLCPEHFKTIVQRRDKKYI